MDNWKNSMFGAIGVLGVWAIFGKYSTFPNETWSTVNVMLVVGGICELLGVFSKVARFAKWIGYKASTRIVFRTILWSAVAAIAAMVIGAVVEVLRGKVPNIPTLKDLESTFLMSVLVIFGILAVIVLLIMLTLRKILPRNGRADLWEGWKDFILPALLLVLCFSLLFQAAIDSDIFLLLGSAVAGALALYIFWLIGAFVLLILFGGMLGFAMLGVLTWLVFFTTTTLAGLAFFAMVVATLIGFVMLWLVSSWLMILAIVVIGVLYGLHDFSKTENGTHSPSSKGVVSEEAPRVEPVVEITGVARGKTISGFESGEGCIKAAAQLGMVYTVPMCKEAAKTIGCPMIVRNGFTIAPLLTKLDRATLVLSPEGKPVRIDFTCAQSRARAQKIFNEMFKDDVEFNLKSRGEKRN